MNDLDKSIDMLKKIVKASTLDSTEKLGLILFLDGMDIGELNITAKGGITKYEKVKSMTIEEMAHEIIELEFTDAYCKSDCSSADEDDYDCPHSIECCVKWLNEEVRNDI